MADIRTRALVTQYKIIGLKQAESDVKKLLALFDRLNASKTSTEAVNAQRQIDNLLKSQVTRLKKIESSRKRILTQQRSQLKVQNQINSSQSRGLTSFTKNQGKANKSAGQFLGILNQISPVAFGIAALFFFFAACVSIYLSVA